MRAKLRTNRLGRIALTDSIELLCSRWAAVLLFTGVDASSYQLRQHGTVIIITVHEPEGLDELFGNSAWRQLEVILLSHR